MKGWDLKQRERIPPYLFDRESSLLIDRESTIPKAKGLHGMEGTWDKGGGMVCVKRSYMYAYASIGKAKKSEGSLGNSYPPYSKKK